MDSYYRVTVADILSDYEMAIPLLTIDDGDGLQAQLNEMSEKNRDNKYIMEAKLQVKRRTNHNIVKAIQFDTIENGNTC